MWSGGGEEEEEKKNEERRRRSGVVWCDLTMVGGGKAGGHRGAR